MNVASNAIDGFDLVREQKDDLRAVELNRDQPHAFAYSALALRQDPTAAQAPTPVTERQLLAAAREPALAAAYTRHDCAERRSRTRGSTRQPASCLHCDDLDLPKRK